MVISLERPRSALSPAGGMLRAEHFQIGYATNDLGRACDLLRSRLGIREFGTIGGPTPAGGDIQVRLAWVGGTMIELMQASGPGSELVAGKLDPVDRFQLRHHHLGYLLHDETEWDAVHAQAARQGWAIPQENDNPGFMKHCFVEVPFLPHYLEFIRPEPAGLAFFENIPAS